MSEYLVSLTVMGALISLSLALAYRDDGALKVALTVLLLYVFTVPLIGAVRDLDLNIPTLDYGYSEYEGQLEDVSCAAYENGIRAYIADKYNLDLADISVKADGYDVATVTAKRVSVILSGGARLADYRAIEEGLKKNGFDSCEVKIAF